MGDSEGAVVNGVLELMDDWVIKVDSRGRVDFEVSEVSDTAFVCSEDVTAGIELAGTVLIALGFFRKDRGHFIGSAEIAIILCFIVLNS